MNQEVAQSLAEGSSLYPVNQMVIVIKSYPFPEWHLRFLKFHDVFQAEAFDIFEFSSPEISSPEISSPEIFKHFFRRDSVPIGKFAVYLFGIVPFSGGSFSQQAKCRNHLQASLPLFQMNRHSRPHQQR